MKRNKYDGKKNESESTLKYKLFYMNKTIYK